MGLDKFLAFVIREGQGVAGGIIEDCFWSMTIGNRLFIQNLLEFNKSKSFKTYIEV